MAFSVFLLFFIVLFILLGEKANVIQFDIRFIFNRTSIIGLFMAIAIYVRNTCTPRDTSPIVRVHVDQRVKRKIYYF